MAQFDLYRLEGVRGLVVDCQSDLLRIAATRFVLPLILESDADIAPSRLNPALPISGGRYVLMTHLPAALPRGLLRDAIGSAREHRLVITSAIDLLTAGV